mgnify:CR=1 FL=1
MIQCESIEKLSTRLNIIDFQMKIIMDGEKYDVYFQFDTFQDTTDSIINELEKELEITLHNREFCLSTMRHLVRCARITKWELLINMNSNV